QLVEEVGAYLDGTALDLFCRRGALVPPWAWLNVLAHGSARAVEARARRHQEVFEPGGSWGWAVGVLATEMLRAAGGDRAELGRIQREVVLPLEISLLGRAPVSVPPPTQLVSIACARLRARPGTHSVG
ncbi:MAG TPA: hypothetical protein VKG43_09150, partial [Acidimicrobiales bacterium]|nr:hypothetical protein [Acidimicrobiales bacterium]